MAVGLGCLLLPVSVFAQDQDQGKQGAEVKGGDHGGKGEATKEVKKGPQRDVTGGAGKAEHATKTDRTVDEKRARDTSTQSTSVSHQEIQRSSSTETAVSRDRSISVKGDRSNHYNGQWIAADTHSDWDQNSVHVWNNHHYRWYDGGWLIIDDESGPGYYETGSIVVRVKQSLAQAGYYQGHFTETIGPHTRRAISNYQSAKGLPVTGHIDGPLLGSLGLQ